MVGSLIWLKGYEYALMALAKVIQSALISDSPLLGMDPTKAGSAMPLRTWASKRE